VIFNCNCHRIWNVLKGILFYGFVSAWLGIVSYGLGENVSAYLQLATIASPLFAALKILLVGFITFVAGIVILLGTIAALAHGVDWLMRMYRLKIDPAHDWKKVYVIFPRTVYNNDITEYRCAMFAHVWRRRIVDGHYARTSYRYEDPTVEIVD